jgi:hypothetical protein
MPLSLDAVLALSQDDLFEIVRRAAPLDLDALADTSYTGIDLSMPASFHKLFWKSFRKTFHRDPATGALRGWNVKVQQTGWDRPPEPKLGPGGTPLSFGHYEVRSARGLKFPRGWTGEHYLDYGVAGNPFYEIPARNGFCPLVSVNPGDSELLLGWEIFKFGPFMLPIADYWVLKREGPLPPSAIIPRPDTKRPALPG